MSSTRKAIGNSITNLRAWLEIVRNYPARLIDDSGRRVGYQEADRAVVRRAEVTSDLALSA